MAHPERVVGVSFVSSSGSSDSLDDGPKNHPCDGSASPSSLLSMSSLTVFAKAFLPGDFHVLFCFSAGAADLVPVDSVSVVSVAAPVAGVGAASVSVSVEGAAAGPVVISLSHSETLLRPLSSAEHGSIGPARPQHSAGIWVLSGIPGLQHNF